MGARRCLWACLGFSWPHIGLSRVLLVDACLAHSPLRRSVWLSARRDIPPTFSLAVVAAATWCSGGPPAAKWAVSGPSCTAAWKAQHCGPGSSPSGRLGTATGRKAQVGNDLGRVWAPPCWPAYPIPDMGCTPRPLIDSSLPRKLLYRSSNISLTRSEFS